MQCVKGSMDSHKTTHTPIAGVSGGLGECACQAGWTAHEAHALVDSIKCHSLFAAQRALTMMPILER
eukprot:scaffold103896_cov20-Tisochrysis_lutea.AAC.1